MAEKIEDLNLPATVIIRLIKEVLPEGVNIGKDARIAIAKAAAVFVIYLTAASINSSKKANRKTLSGADVLESLSDVEFKNFIEPLKESLEAYKKLQRDKRDAQAKRKSENTKDANEKESTSDVELIDE